MNEQTWVSRPTRIMLALLAAVVALSAVPASSTTPAATAQETAGGEEVIVVLDDGADPVAVAQEMGVAVTHVYRNVFTGFAGILPAGAADEARASRSVQRIFPDGDVQAEAQIIPTGVRRSGTPIDPDDEHLAISSPIDADIAILDTGVNAVGDLTIAGGTSCVSEPKEKKKKKGKKNKKGKKGKKGNKGKGGKKDKKGKKGKRGKKGNKNKNKKKKKDNKGNNGTTSWADDNGHGTHTAGIAAAIDNDQGVVGVAPGARIWAVKVLDANGDGSFSDVICGLDWVFANQGTIDVVNLSLGGAGSDDVCNVNAAPFHQAICNVVNIAGIPVVVAAGNQRADASTRVPAAYDEVITVSGLADSNGAPGGGGSTECINQIDDTFFSFSNFGEDVDIMAPAVCILSLSNTGGTATESGTSEAAPHVAGAAAIYIAQQGDEPATRPLAEETRLWLLTDASRSQTDDGVTGDPDPDLPGFRERVLWLQALPVPPP